MYRRNIKLLSIFNFLIGFSLFTPLAILYFAKVSGSYILGTSVFGIIMISTATMIRLGKTYQNMMIDLRPMSRKLEARSQGILMKLLGIEYDAAAALLASAGGSVKRALCMGMAGCDAAAADRRLESAGGVLRRAVESR